MVKRYIWASSLGLLLAGASLAQAAEMKTSRQAPAHPSEAHGSRSEAKPRAPKKPKTTASKAQPPKAEQPRAVQPKVVQPTATPSKTKQPKAEKSKAEPTRAAGKRPAAKGKPSRVKRQKPKPTARIVHAPLMTVAEGQGIHLEAELRDAHEAKRLLVIYRAGGETEYEELTLQRTADLGYAGRVPPESTQPGHFEYAIEVEGHDGRRTAVFASREQPQRVQVRHDHGVMVSEALRRRLGGRTTQVKASADWVRFGQSRLETAENGTVEDEYWRMEAEYRHRLLRGVQEFGVRIGALRGSSPVPARQSTTEAPNEVGLNYATPFVQLRLHELFRVEGSATVAVTEVEFALGAGGELQFGDPLGTQLVAGLSGIQGFGIRGHARLDVRASSELILSPDIELTNQPNADRIGLRLSGQAAYALTPGFTLALRGGYQARDAESGGIAMGSSLSYSF